MCHLADTRILLYQGGEHGCTPGSAPSENFLKTLTKSLDVGITGVYSPRLYTNVVDKVDKRRVETMEFSGNGSRGGKTMGDRPNVVVIVADTFRGDHLGAYGNPRIRTPHLDEFARSEEHTSELQSRGHLVCRLLLEKKKTQSRTLDSHTNQETDQPHDT